MKPFSLEEYLANPNRKVITRDGRNVRIVCTDAKQPNPIIALVELPNHYESVILYSKTGKFWTNGTSHPNDLFFASEKKEGWINLYKGSDGSSFVTSGVFKSEENAEIEGRKLDGYIATNKIEWDE